MGRSEHRVRSRFLPVPLILRLIHFKVIQTPLFKDKIALEISPICDECTLDEADRLHSFTSRPKIGNYSSVLSEVVNSLNQRLFKYFWEYHR